MTSRRPGFEPAPAADRRGRPFFRRVGHPPSEPRRANPTPAGWVSEPVGRWAGHETEVVYDPRRYDVMLTTEVRPGVDAATLLEADGWERRGADGDRALWIRDKVAAIRAALTRFDGAGLGGRAVVPPGFASDGSTGDDGARAQPSCRAAMPEAMGPSRAGMEPPELRRSISGRRPTGTAASRRRSTPTRVRARRCPGSRTRSGTASTPSSGARWPAIPTRWNSTNGSERCSTRSSPSSQRVRRV